MMLLFLKTLVSLSSITRCEQNNEHVTGEDNSELSKFVVNYPYKLGQQDYIAIKTEERIFETATCRNSILLFVCLKVMTLKF